jgi:hypothetical protein
VDLTRGRYLNLNGFTLEVVDMSWKLIAVLALISLGQMGCSTIDGIRDNKRKPRPDLPELSIEEQMRRGRNKYAIPEDDWRIGPPTGNGQPSPIGR